MRHILIVIFLVISNQALAQDLQTVDIWLIEGNYTKAASLAEQLLKKDTTNAILNYKLGIIYQSLNDYKNAYRYLKTAKDLDSTNINYLNAYANILSEIGLYKKSIKAFQLVLEKEPDNYYALDKISSLYVKTENYNKANNAFEVLSRLFPDNPHYLRQIAYCYLKQKDGISALIFYKNAYELDSSDIKSIKQFAQLYLRAKLYDACIKIATRGVNVDSTYSDFYNLRAKAYFGKNHNFLAIKDYVKCIELGDSTFEIVKYLGIAYNLAQKPVLAHPYLLAAFAEDSTDNDVTLYLGRNYLALDSFELSLKYFDKTFEIITPSKYLVFNIYGDMAKAYSATNQYQKALEMFALRYEKLNYYSNLDFYSMAILYDNLNNSAKAIEYFSIYIDNVEPLLIDKENDKQFNYALSRRNRLLEQEHMNK